MTARAVHLRWTCPLLSNTWVHPRGMGRCTNKSRRVGDICRRHSNDASSGIGGKSCHFPFDINMSLGAPYGTLDSDTASHETNSALFIHKKRFKRAIHLFFKQTGLQAAREAVERVAPHAPSEVERDGRHTFLNKQSNERFAEIIIDPSQPDSCSCCDMTREQLRCRVKSDK